MKIVIACARRKRADAGLMQTTEGTLVMFVGNPQHETVPRYPGQQFAKPDDLAERDETWRDRLRDYNKNYQKVGVNPFRLLPAWKLYKPSIYGKLVNKYGAENVYILSAGWGLVSVDFLLPDYDITYNQNINKEEKYKCRQKNNGYKDFNMLPNKETDCVVFFGGNDYLKPFCELTKGYAGKRICFYATNKIPDVKGVVLKDYGRSFNNWHYCAAQELIDGKLVL